MAGVVDQFRQGSVQLFDGNIHSLVGLSADNIHDGLSLGQIDPTVEEGTLGKFTRFSQTSSLTDDQLQDFVCHSNPSVRVDLNNVLTSEGLRRAHGSNHDFIEDLILIWIHDVAVVEGMAGHTS